MMLAARRRGRVRVGGVGLAYAVYGEGVPLLLIEGLGYAAWMWFKQVPAFAERYQVVVFDNRGVGDSDKPDEPYTIPGMADDAAGLLDQLGLGPAHVLGVSMGGMIAQELALRRPELVRGLVLACTTLGGAAQVPMSLATMQAITSLRQDVPPEEALLLAMQYAVSPTYFRRAQDELRRIVAWRLEKPTPRHAWIRQWNAGAAHDAADRAGLIQAPTLVLAGDEDLIVPLENARLLAARLPNARLEVFPGGGHLFFVEQAEAFNRAVLTFLDEVSMAGDGRPAQDSGQRRPTAHADLPEAPDEPGRWSR